MRPQRVEQVGIPGNGGQDTRCLRTLGGILLERSGDERLGQRIRTCGDGELFFDEMRATINMALHLGREQIGLGAEVIEDAAL